ncbi:uncharacterized protein LOC101894721 [Musca domestica]|uniref:Uncharacterized protein LOC101894721 n=1 Tax=Musca domestica TaxID=7370 RepID=A0A1I8MPM2_MUSDO|nr:uncharacterized protein LOC101894721 [Musca domestica]
MSYQIKSTPYFQRIISASKKNGQLQQLKEEYERIKDFDEKAIEKKMRQVRLKRLFKEIEDLKQANRSRRKRSVVTDEATTMIPNDPRVENVIKGRKLGEYYSQLNGYDEVPTTSKMPAIEPSVALRIGLLSKKQIQERSRQREEKMKAKVNDRINYGNRISNWNMHKMLQRKLHHEVSEGIKQTFCAVVKGNKSFSRQDSNMASETSSVDGKERLKTRIDFGNYLSQKNRLVVMKRNWKKSREPKESSKQDNTHSSSLIVIDSSKHSHGVGEELSYKSATGISDAVNWERRKKAQENWHKLTFLILCRKALIGNCTEGLAFKLRCISNDTNIRQNDFVLQRNSSLETCDTEEECREILRNKQNLFHRESINIANKIQNKLSLPSVPILNTNKPHHLSLKPIPNAPTSNLSRDQQIQSLIENYAPISMEVVKKEVIEGVQKLREIFEHQRS